MILSDVTASGGVVCSGCLGRLIHPHNLGPCQIAKAIKAANSKSHTQFLPKNPPPPAGVVGGVGPVGVTAGGNPEGPVGAVTLTPPYKFFAQSGNPGAETPGREIPLKLPNKSLKKPPIPAEGALGALMPLILGAFR